MFGLFFWCFVVGSSIFYLGFFCFAVGGVGVLWLAGLSFCLWVVLWV